MTHKVYMYSITIAYTTIRWFETYMVMCTNDNATYHHAELEGVTIAMSVVGKRIKAFKKRHEQDLYPDVEEEEAKQSKESEFPKSMRRLYVVCMDDRVSDIFL